jgi:hypothetical protein
MFSIQPIISPIEDSIPKFLLILLIIHFLLLFLRKSEQLRDLIISNGLTVRVNLLLVTVQQGFVMRTTLDSET